MDAVNTDELAQKLARAFIAHAPKNEPGQARWSSSAHKHPYSESAAQEALAAMSTLARRFPYSEAGPALALPLGSINGALWPFGEGWQLRVLPAYDHANDTLSLHVTIRRA